MDAMVKAISAEIRDRLCAGNNIKFSYFKSNRYGHETDGMTVSRKSSKSLKGECMYIYFADEAIMYANNYKYEVPYADPDFVDNIVRAIKSQLKI